MIERNLEAAVGMSRKWDARDAGRELARIIIDKLKSPPNFFIVFSTIHYEKNGGFKNFLNGIWDILPKETPLVGGTVPGFMNNYGSYSRGATAIAVSYSNMDVVVGFGKNTKRNPKKAANQCSRTIKEGLKNSPYNKKFLFNFVSGPETMKIPGQGYTNVVKSGWVSKFVSVAFGFSQYLLQKGTGREDEVLEEMVNKLPEYNMLLGASINNYEGINNFQFYNDRILTNSVVSLGLSTDLDLQVCTTHGMKKTDTNFEITKLSKDGHIIHKIDNKPAVPELMKKLNWPENFLNEKTMYNIIPYYPISLKRHHREVPAVMAAILKDSIITPCKIEKDKVSILTVSGNNLLSAVNENLATFINIKPSFGLFSTCLTILQTLGYKTEMIREEIMNFFQESPFILFWCAGEGTYSPEKNITYANMSFNTAIFSQNKTEKNFPDDKATNN